MNEISPLSFAQQRVWFMHQLKPDSPLYNVFHSIHFSTPVNTPALKQALEKIVSRHEILRTGFVLIDDKPFQKVRPSTDVSIREVSLVSRPDAKQELATIAAAEVAKPFDLARDQLLRFTLVHVQPAESFLLICMHHIITDAWSTGIFNRELKLFYEAATGGLPLPVAPLDRQYRDYAVWQRNWMNTDERQEQLAFWEKQLADLPTFQLPISKQSSENLSFRGQSKPFKVETPDYSRLRKLSQQEEQTLFITLLAAFNVLLFRYSGQHDIVIGCPVSGRNRTAWEEMMGLFVNTVVLRSTLKGDESFSAVSRKIKQVAFDAFEHQDIPFEMVVETLHPSRDFAKNPLYQVVFQLQSVEEAAAGLPDEADPASVQITTSKFDLTLCMVESPHGLSGYFEYNSDLFPGQVIDSLIKHFLHLLQHIASGPDTVIAELQLLDSKEELLVRNTGKGLSTNTAKDVFVHELISEVAHAHPERTAVFSETKQMSYGQLEEQSNRLAQLLISRRLGAEPIIVVCMNRSITMVVCHLAILKAGAAFVPLDAGYPQERLVFMLRDIQPDLVITESALAEGLPLEGYAVFITDKDWHLLDGHPDTVPVTALTLQHRAYIMFTSGSTGKPKGVELLHRGFSNLVRWNIKAYSIGADDRCLQMATPAYDAYIFELFPCLAAGATAYLIDDITRTSYLLLRKELIEKKIGITFLSTAIGQAVMDEPWPSGTSLRVLAVGGEKLWRLPTVPPPFQYLNFYGPTENSVMTTWYTVAMNNKNGIPPIGRPLDNVRLYVLDTFLNLLPMGVPGELYLGGEGCGRGYFHRPALTAGKFVPDPFSEEPGSRLYRTGDLVRFLADGNLEFIGRVDHQVKLRGFRIELEEIEQLLHDHPALNEAVVVMRDGGQSMTAYVARAEGMNISSTAVRAYLKERLPAFMIPSSIVVMDELPKSFNGKIDRKALPVSTPDEASHETAYEEAQTEMEKNITDIWKMYLSIDKLSVEANFFDMGGHSLMMSQVHHRLKQTLQKEIPLISLFQYPTIRSLARHLENVPVMTAAPKVEDRASRQRQAFLQQKRNHRTV